MRRLRGASSTTRSASASSAGAVRDHDDGAPAHEPADRAHDLGLGGAVEAGGRLVEQQQRRVAQERAGEREPLALAGRQPGAVVAEPRLQARRAARRSRPPGARRRARARPPRRARPGGRVRTLSAIVPANRCGRCGTQASWACQAARSSSRRSVPPTRTAPAVGVASPSSTRSSVDFPHPLGPAIATTSPGSTVSDSAVERRRRATRRRPRSGPRGISVRVPRAGSGASSASRIWRRGRGALGARVVALAEPAQRQVGLRGEHEHEQRGLELERAAQQPQADRDRDQRHRERGQQLEHERGEERDPQRPSACSRYAAPTVAIAAACGFARPNTFSVGRPATTSRKWPPSRCRLRTWASIRSRVVAPTSAMNSGISGSVNDDDRGRDPVAARAGRRARPRARSRPARPAAGSARSSRRARRSRASPASPPRPARAAGRRRWRASAARRAARTSRARSSGRRPSRRARRCAARTSTTASSAASAPRERSVPAITPASSHACATSASAAHHAERHGGRHGCPDGPCAPEQPAVEGHATTLERPGTAASPEAGDARVATGG